MLIVTSQKYYERNIDNEIKYQKGLLLLYKLNRSLIFNERSLITN